MSHLLSLRRVRWAAGALTLSGSALAHAGIAPPGGSIDFAPLAVAVPTVGAWALGLIALLLSVVAYRVLRGRVGGRLTANLLLAGGALLAAFTGDGVVREAAAIAASDQAMASATGGTVSWSYWVRLTNTSGVALQVMAIRPNARVILRSPPPESPECTVGTQVAAGAKCNVWFDYPPAD